MQWKKYSCGLIPVKNLPSTNPPARGLVSYGMKDGKERPKQQGNGYSLTVIKSKTMCCNFPGLLTMISK